MRGMMMMKLMIGAFFLMAWSPVTLADCLEDCQKNFDAKAAECKPASAERCASLVKGKLDHCKIACGPNEPQALEVHCTPTLCCFWRNDGGFIGCSRVVLP